MSISTLTAIFCPMLSDLRNGKISYDLTANEDLPFGTVVSYSCNAGHMLVGDETRKCTGGSSSILGYFDGIEPVCQGTVQLRHAAVYIILVRTAHMQLSPTLKTFFYRNHLP